MKISVTFEADSQLVACSKQCLQILAKQMVVAWAPGKPTEMV